MASRSMQQVADELRGLIANFGVRLRELKDADIATRPRPDKWARKEVLGHLIDSAANNHQKFVRMMSQQHLDFPGYKQDEWVDQQKYASANWDVMVELWSLYNYHIARLIENVDPSYLGHTIRIEDAGPFTLEFIMADYVEHMKHHIKQIFPDVDLDNAFENVYGA